MLTIKFNPAEFCGETRRISANRSTCTNLHSPFLSPQKIDFRGEMSRRFAVKSRCFSAIFFSSGSNFLLFLREKKAIVHGEKNKKGKIFHLHCKKSVVFFSGKKLQTIINFGKKSLINKTHSDPFYNTNIFILIEKNSSTNISEKNVTFTFKVSISYPHNDDRHR